MSQFDIFKDTDAAPQNGEFFKFANKGDGVQGTYIDQREGKDGFGNDQIIYVLKGDGGKIWNAAFKKSSIVVHERMKGARLGYIVGFKYEDTGVVKRGANAGTKFRIINVYFDPKHVDKDWMDSHPGATVSESVGTSDSPSLTVVRNDSPEDVSPMRAPFPEEGEAEYDKITEDSLKAILNLALSKGLTNESMTDEQAAVAVEEFAQLELSEENLAKIIIKLTTYKA